MKSNELAQDAEKKASMARFIEAERAYFAEKKRRELSEPLRDAASRMERAHDVERDNFAAVEREDAYWNQQHEDSY